MRVGLGRFSILTLNDKNYQAKFFDRPCLFFPCEGNEKEEGFFFNSFPLENFTLDGGRGINVSRYIYKPDFRLRPHRPYLRFQLTALNIPLNCLFMFGLRSRRGHCFRCGQNLRKSRGNIASSITRRKSDD